MTSSSPAGRDAQNRPAIPLWAIRLMTGLNRAVHRWSGGRLMNSMGGRPICFVTMRGAKTARERLVPLMYVPYRDGVLLAGSQGGAAKDPAWVRNLAAHPDVTVVQSGRTMALTAQRLEGDERDDAWTACVKAFPPYADYAQRTTREIPVFYCGPKVV